MTGSAASKPVTIDAHTHIFPPDVCADRTSRLHRDGWFNNLYQSSQSKLATAEDLIASMDAAGIGRSIACGFPWADPGLCRDHNAYLAEACAQHPDRISWLGIVVPGTASAETDARWCFEHGARGLGEFNADAQGFDFRDADSMRSIAGICGEAERPVMIHASEPVGHAYPGKGAVTPDKVLEFVKSFPSLAVVAAHWGGGLPFYELMPEVARLTRGLCYDSGASTHLYDFRVFRSVIDIVGPEKVLFGSDFPVLGQRRFLERTMEIAWSSNAERAAVLGSNAARVYKLLIDEVNQ